MVQNTVEQTEIFNRHSELHTEDLANKFRSQQLRFSEEAKIVKEQTVFLRKILSQRLAELQNKIGGYQVKLGNLSRRRELDLEGFINDTKLIQKKSRDLEDRIRKKN